MHAMVRAAWLSLLAATGVVNAAAPITELKGEAYDLESGELLYHEFHSFSYADGQPVSAKVEYKTPDGNLIGDKTLDFRPSLFVPAFETRLYDGRYVEGLKHEDDKLVLIRKSGSDEAREEKRIRLKQAMAADAGFNPYVQARFDDLLEGEEVKFKFVAPNRLTAVNFVAERLDDGTVRGLPVVRFRVKLDSLLSLFIDPLTLSYDPDTRYLIEYRGLSNVRDEDGELYKTRIIYPQLLPESGSK